MFQSRFHRVAQMKNHTISSSPVWSRLPSPLRWSRLPSCHAQSSPYSPIPVGQGSANKNTEQNGSIQAWVCLVLRDRMDATGTVVWGVNSRKRSSRRSGLTRNGITTLSGQPRQHSQAHTPQHCMMQTLTSSTTVGIFMCLISLE